ncbi:hypothetical protein T440DRAFT_410812 [Plenodomus tracheiphilus IPT5]|uniref:Uncharacterized protein n=1 Tax=Plenodomus tracheiphilus IPT5 TaxID=1408161 RepID=A0A6A7AN45_9PLEO|nr:hypothetical protein T440DRAFT_410812 [Plenodomus tracheiphilus IPT5]
MAIVFDKLLERLIRSPVHRHNKILLGGTDDESLLTYAWTRMREAEEDFMYTGKAFLSLLASVEDLFCYRWTLKNPWSRLPEENPTSKGSLTERILKSLHCAETIEFESAIDPAKLRMARILLYHHFEQKCTDLRKDPKIASYLSQGKGIASVANDAILEEIYGCNDQITSKKTWRKRASRFAWHKRIGKRWSFVAYHLGVGIILTCSHELATYV